MAWLEGSGLGHLMRESGVWTYGLVNLTHILGVACLFGSVLVLDLRLLGAWRSVGLATISVPTVPLATAGFAVAVASGICLIATNGTEYVDNPFVYIKFPAIGLGVLNVIVLNRLSAWQERMTRQESARERLQLRVIGAVSLFSWLVAVAAGRMIGYW
jgi:multidrug transporter EmrE-like cation transporter